jgi:intracellular sulfur oxidation DsrE/DsrF family protein
MSGERMFKTIGALGLMSALSVVCGLSVAETPSSWQTPAISGYGKIYVAGEKNSAYAESAQTLPKSAFHIDGEVTPPKRVAFQIDGDVTAPKNVNASLEKVARSINLYVADGVPLDHLNCVVMLGRSSAALALNDRRYRERYGVANPNLDLLNKLRAAGVQVVVSEQALADQHWDKNDLTQNAALALSSLTAVSSLAQNGYTVMPL